MSDIATLLLKLDEQADAAERIANQPNANGDLQYTVNIAAAIAIRQVKQAILDSESAAKGNQGEDAK